MSSNQFIQLKLKLFYFVQIIRNSTVPGIWKYPLWAFGILPLGVWYCVLGPVEHDEVAFSDLTVAVPWQERVA